MIYQRLLPHPAFQFFVKEYLLLHFVYDATKPSLVKPFPPLPEHGLEFFPKPNTLLSESALSPEKFLRLA